MLGLFQMVVFFALAMLPKDGALAFSAPASNNYDSSVYYDQSKARDSIDQACYESAKFWKELDDAIPGWRTNKNLQRFQGFCHNLQSETPGREIFLDNSQQVLAQYFFPGIQDEDGESRSAYPTKDYAELQTLQKNLKQNVAPVARRELDALIGARPLVSDDEEFSGIEENDGDTWQRAAWYGWQYLSLRGAQRWMPKTTQALKKNMGDAGPAHRFVGITRQKAGVAGVEHSDGRNYMLSTLTPIRSPPKCGIVVNGEEAAIEQGGNPVILDNTFPHHVFNNGEDDRYVLMSECWHPGLTLEERDALAQLFAVKDRFTVTDLKLAPWGYDDDSLEFALKTDALHDLDFWKEIGYDREAALAASVLEKTTKAGKKKKAAKGAGASKSKGFGK